MVGGHHAARPLVTASPSVQANAWASAALAGGGAAVGTVTPAVMRRLPDSMRSGGPSASAPASGGGGSSSAGAAPASASGYLRPSGALGPTAQECMPSWAWALSGHVWASAAMPFAARSSFTSHTDCKPPHHTAEAATLLPPPRPLPTGAETQAALKAVIEGLQLAPGPQEEEEPPQVRGWPGIHACCVCGGGYHARAVSGRLGGRGPRGRVRRVQGAALAAGPQEAQQLPLGWEWGTALGASGRVLAPGNLLPPPRLTIYSAHRVCWPAAALCQAVLSVHLPPHQQLALKVQLPLTHRSPPHPTAHNATHLALPLLLLPTRRRWSYP